MACAVYDHVYVDVVWRFSVRIDLNFLGLAHPSGENEGRIDTLEPILLGRFPNDRILVIVMLTQEKSHAEILLCICHH